MMLSRVYVACSVQTIISVDILLLLLFIGREEQVVPGGYLPLLTDIDEPQTNQRQLPSCNNERVKLLELFTGDDGDIFASREE